MIDALDTTTETNPLVRASGDVPISLTPHLAAVFHHDPKLVAHGDHPRDLDTLACLTGDDNQAVITWVETWWDGSAIGHDAKRILRTEFGKRGIVAQFLNTCDRTGRDQ